MKKWIPTLVLSSVLFIFLIGCSSDVNPEIEMGYTLPAIPVRVAINSHGNISVEFSGQWTTPVGTFDIQSSADIYSVQNRYDSNVLIVRVDDKAVVYELQTGKKFHIEFDDSNTLYRRVALYYEDNGDIVLELESVQQSTSSSQNTPKVAATERPQPTKSTQTTTPEEFIIAYFTDIVTRRNYGYLWTLSTDRFKQANSDGDYQDFVKFWNSVDDVYIEFVSCSNQDAFSVSCQAEMTWRINGSDVSLDLDYDLIYDKNKDSWIFE